MIDWAKKLRVEFGAAFIWLVCLIYFTQFNPRSNNVLEVEEEPITSEKVIIVTLKLLNMTQRSIQSRMDLTA
ncbi:hypothetical protein RJ639_039441 [Escallonia herrerae]|uniref:Uncharacterized protein n=1 Tax=Escallonia herrerae TaxID=1293975 RepID=A0AA89B3D6_9ASTE|nr:hypothetical protein RJ639_039441 [Escallonia herrerae]